MHSRPGRLSGYHLTVNVAANAPASVTNTANVSGGTESNTGNNSANDATTINSNPPSISLVKSVSPNGFQQPGPMSPTQSFTPTVRNGGEQLYPCRSEPGQH